MKKNNRSSITLSFLIWFVYCSVFAQSDIFRVTLDAGHGAHDFGANYSGRVEKISI